jgi:hypothetical protein
MSVSITMYGVRSNYWNAGISSDSPTPKDVLVNLNSTSTTLNATVTWGGDTYTVLAQGRFQYTGPIGTMEGVSGIVTDTTFYKNQIIAERDVITQGADVINWFFPSTTVAQYLVHAPVLNTGVTFLGSQSPQEWGDTLIGGLASDSFTSFAGKITTAGGQAYFDGKGGVDTAIMQGKVADYTVRSATFTDNTDAAYQAQVTGWQVVDSIASRNGTTKLVNVERLKFTDTNIALDVQAGQNAGMAFRMYKAALNREPDYKGLGDWINVLDKGYDKITVLAAGFTGSSEFQTRYGTNLSTTDFVTLLYNNVLGRGPDAGGLKAWVDAIDVRGASRELVLYGFSESTENINYSLTLIGNGAKYIEHVG